MARYEIGEGAKIKIPENVKSGIDSKGIPFWKFPVRISTQINGENVPFDTIWLKIIGKPFDGWLQINRIIKLNFARARNSNGGIIIFRTLLVDVEKV